MLISGTLLGLNFLSLPPRIPQLIDYDTIEIFGGSTIDKLRLMNKNFTQAEITALTVKDEYIWDSYTRMYSEFNQTLISGNVTGIINPVTHWQIYRREIGEINYVLIDTLDVSVIEYIDYTAKANKKYIYRVLGVNNSEISNPLDSNEVSCDWYYWSLIDPETDEVFLLELDVSSDTIKRKHSYYYYDTAYSKYTPVTHGEQNYLEGSINFLAGAIPESSGDFLYPDDYLDRLGNFITNGRSKILKSRKGDAWVVSTTDFNFNYIDEIEQQVANVSFSFREIDDLL